MTSYNDKYFKRCIEHKKIYKVTVWWQGFLHFFGIAWHNSFSDECTKDFNCCEPDIGSYAWLRVSFRRRNKE